MADGDLLGRLAWLAHGVSTLRGNKLERHSGRAQEGHGGGCRTKDVVSAYVGITKVPGSKPMTKLSFRSDGLL